MSELIKIKQELVIVHDLKNVGQQVTDRLSELNIEGQIATDDTIKSLKSLRAELNKEFAEFKLQFKTVNDVVIAPITAFKAEFKDEIESKYNAADETLKTTIGAHETKVKQAKESNVKVYFDELCASEGLDFLIFANVGLDINLSTTEKKYKEQCNEFILRIKDDLQLIETMEYKVEILAEYKTTLNASKSITTVADRKLREKDEAEKVKQVEYLRRSKLLQGEGLAPDKETGTYAFNDSIYLVWDSVKDLPVSEFSKLLIEKSLEISEFKAGVKQAPIIAPEVNKPVELLAKG